MPQLVCKYQHQLRPGEKGIYRNSPASLVVLICSFCKLLLSRKLVVVLIHKAVIFGRHEVQAVCVPVQLISHSLQTLFFTLHLLLFTLEITSALIEAGSILFAKPSRRRSLLNPAIQFFNLSQV